MDMHAGIDYQHEFLGHFEGSMVTERSEAQIHSGTGRAQLEIGSMIHHELSRIGLAWANSLRLPSPLI